MAASVTNLSQSDSDSDPVRILLPEPRDGCPSEAVVLPGNFQRAILKDVLAEDGLLVISRGLGGRDIVSKLLQLYCRSSTLVFVLNASADEAWRLRQSLAQAGSCSVGHCRRITPVPLAMLMITCCLSLTVAGVSESSLPAVVNNETPAASRKTVYSSGGVVFVTSRILVMDLLTHRILPAAITGFVLLNAHSLTETGIEAFILRIYRRHTACGFVKAFTDDPIALASSFGRLERTLRTLMVRRVHLWPRFHLAVRKQLQKTEPEVPYVYLALAATVSGLLLSLVQRSCVV
jgi:DNA excision repair protein ERCC-4